MAITIPVQDQKAVIELFELNGSERANLISAIGDSNPLMDMNEFAEQLSEKLSLSEGKVKRILRVLVNLYSVMEYLGNSPSVIAEELVESARSFDSEVFRSASSSAIADFQEFVHVLLSFTDSLGVSAKVLRVINQHEHIFLRSDLYTDLRPVFGIGDSSLRPAAGVLLHTLRIEYRKDLEEKTIYIAMDYKDLGQLRETIERALNKHDALVNTWGNSIHILDSQ